MTSPGHGQPCSNAVCPCAQPLIAVRRLLARDDCNPQTANPSMRSGSVSALSTVTARDNGLVSACGQSSGRPAAPCRRWRAAVATPPRGGRTATRPGARHGPRPWPRPAKAAPSSAGCSARAAHSLSSPQGAVPAVTERAAGLHRRTGRSNRMPVAVLEICCFLGRRRHVSGVKPAPSALRRCRSGGAGSCARRRGTPSTRAARRSLLAPVAAHPAGFVTGQHTQCECCASTTANCRPQHVAVIHTKFVAFMQEHMLVGTPEICPVCSRIYFGSA